MLAGLTVGLINLAKPMHIDDHLYRSIARRIVENPVDPYGGPIYWMERIEPAWNVSISPPLFNYWLALWIKLFGDHDLVVKLAMLPLAALLGWSAGRLSLRWTGDVFAGLLVAFSPAVTAGMNLMLDVPVTALILLALDRLFAAEDAMEPTSRDRSVTGRVLVAGLILAAAVLTKFVGLAILPLVVLRALARRRPSLLLAALPGVIAFVGWQTLARAMYGKSQADQGLSFLAAYRFDVLLMATLRTLTGLSLVGLTFPIGLAALSAGRWRWPGLLVGGLAVGLYLAIQPARDLPPLVDGMFLVGLILGVFAWVFTLRGPRVAASSPSPSPSLDGMGDASKTVGQASKPAIASTPDAAGRSDPPPFPPPQGGRVPAGVPLGSKPGSVIASGGSRPPLAGNVEPTLWLHLWILGAAGFVILFGPFVAVRSFLPILLPLAVLTVNRLEPARVRFGRGLAAAAIIGLGLVVGGVDLVWARVYPDLVARVDARIRRESNSPIHFVGHWGWQHYGERLGWRPWESPRSAVEPGAWLAIPRAADPKWIHPMVIPRLEEVERFTAAPPPGVTSWNRGAGIRFHGGEPGEIPWGPDRQPMEEVILYRFRAAPGEIPPSFRRSDP
jgi:hypothetical protein